MMGTWLQSEQTDKDLAQARRKEFFGGAAPSTSGGEKMKVEW
jgi:conjugal transfer/entry exclusion protein